MIPDLKEGLDYIEQLAASIGALVDMAQKRLGDSYSRSDLALIGKMEMMERLRKIAGCAMTIRDLADVLDKEREEAGE